MLHNRAAMKKKLSASAFSLIALLTVATLASLVGLGRANPYMYHEWTSPPPGASPLVISVSSPKNNTEYNTNLITITLNVSTPETQNTSVSYLLDVHYKADWIRNDEPVYVQNQYSPQFPSFTEHSRLSWVPDGNHSIVITARGGGGYAEGDTAYYFDMESIAIINFTVDTSPPGVSLLSLKNETYTTNCIPLDFTVNEYTSSVFYSLDNCANTTIDGNTTLAGLMDGSHNLTVYVNDNAGNSRASETVYFSVQAPPLISILSPNAKTYVTSNNLLTLSVSEPVSWMGYSLDGNANETIVGNTTLSWLSGGLHTLIVYASDEAGNIGVSETIQFSITAITAEVGAITLTPIAFGSAVLLVYFKKRKRGAVKGCSSGEQFVPVGE